MTRRRRWQLPEPAPATATGSAERTLLHDLIRALLRAERSDEAYQFALDRTCPAVGATLGAVYVVDGASELMRLEAAYGWPDHLRPWLSDMSVRLGVGPSGEAASERRVIEVADVLADPGLDDWQEVAQELGFRALVALPLEAPNSVLGAITFYFATPGVRTLAEKATLRAATDLMAVIADREALRTRLRRAEAALEDQRTPPLVRTEDSEATDG